MKSCQSSVTRSLPHVLLVDSRSTYNVTISHEPIKNKNVNKQLDVYAKGLGVEKEYLQERIALIKTRPEYETMVLKDFLRRFPKKILLPVRMKPITQVTKTPYLGDIPYLGRLFRRTAQDKEKTETLIFITPRILSDNLLD